jgi:IS1 family transposase
LLGSVLIWGLVFGLLSFYGLLLEIRSLPTTSEHAAKGMGLNRGQQANVSQFALNANSERTVRELLRLDVIDGVIDSCRLGISRRETAIIPKVKCVGLGIAQDEPNIAIRDGKWESGRIHNIDLNCQLTRNGYWLAEGVLPICRSSRSNNGSPPVDYIHPWLHGTFLQIELPCHQIALTTDSRQCSSVNLFGISRVLLHHISLPCYSPWLCLHRFQGFKSKHLSPFIGFSGFGHLGFHQLNLLLHCVGLPLYLPQRPHGSSSAEQSDSNERHRRVGCPFDSPERPPLCFQHAVFLCAVLGGFSFGLFAIMRLHDEGTRWRTYHVFLGLGTSVCGCLAAAAAWLTYPFTWGLPPQWIPARWNPCRQSQSHKQQPLSHTENVSPKLSHATTLLCYNNYMANVLGTDKQIAIISSLCEGSSIRSVERITGVHRDTIMRLGAKVGQGCTALMDAKMRNLSCTRLEMDEIWGYVGKKERHLRPSDDPQFGDVWTFCAIDADTKLVPTFRVAHDRDANTATAFVLDVADRMKNRVQISTDGLAAYVDAIDWAFGGNVDYGQIIKTYGTEQSIEAQRRYSAPKIDSTKKKAVFGRPDFDLISTSYIERLNATTRLHMKRLARLAHAFSKKRENFEAAVGLHFAYYNFVRRHNTLRCTPAMEAGVEPSFWSVGDLLEATA